MHHAAQPLCEGQSAGALTTPLLGPGTPQLDSPPFSALVKPSGCSVARRMSLSHENVQLGVADADPTPPALKLPAPHPALLRAGSPLSCSLSGSGWGQGLA